MRIFMVFAVLLLPASMTSGCGKKDTPQPATQVAVRVNNDEITVHQVNFVLTRSQNASPERVPQLKREVLDRLIDQQLAKQKAIENKLDRSPQVVQAIEAAKNEVLARAYLEGLAAAVPMPASWEIEKYYAQHPELFSQRRLFDLEEFVLEAGADAATELSERLRRIRSMQEVADWLQSRGIRFLANRGLRAAEQIRLDMLPKLQEMRAGEIRMFEAGSGRYQIIRVVAFRPEPFDEATAAPLIQRFLLDQRSREYVAREMERIKQQAKIEFLGEFLTDSKPEPPAGASESGAKGQAAGDEGVEADPHR